MIQMSICICGWYFEKFDPWYMSLHRVKDKYPVFVVANRQDPFLEICDLPFEVRENTGLEWGAYNHYLMNKWPGEGGVLFAHDDIVLNSVIVNGEVLPPEWILGKIAECGVDQAYIFGSRAEDVENHGQHGRMVYMSEGFLTKAKETGGFWYDPKNKGYVTGEDAHLREKFDCLGYNAGIISFHAQAKAIGGDVHRKIFIPALDLAKRGTPTEKQLHYGKWIAKVDAMVSKSREKVNVGSGDMPLTGYENVDLYDDRADIKADAQSLPFDDDSKDLIEAHHLIEHFDQDNIKDVLSEWLRVLRPGGHIFVSCPDLVSCMQAFYESADTPEVWAGFMHVLYGETKPGMKHHFGYCKQSLTRLLESIGFIGVEVMTAFGVRPTPSLLAIGQKP